jgi:hypothetical protein
MRLQSRSVRALLTLSGESNGDAAAAAQCVDVLVYHLSSLVIERRVSNALRQLAAVLLHELASDEPRVLRPSFRGYDNSAVVPLLLPVLAWCGVAASVATNAEFLLHCAATTDAPTRSAAILALVRLKERRWLHGGVPAELRTAVGALDAQLAALLADRSALAPSAGALVKPSPSKRPTMAALVGKLSSAIASSSLPAVVEPDGAAQRDFFTVLNTPRSYSHMQVCDVVAFSALVRWLRASASSRAEPPSTPELRAAAMAYCVRVIEQAGAPLTATDGAAGVSDGLDDGTVAAPRRASSAAASASSSASGSRGRGGDAQFVTLDESIALAEVARVLVELARLGDAADAQRAAQLLRRAYERLPTGSASTAAHSFAHLSMIGGVLQIAARWRLVVDIEPMVRGYFTAFLPRHTCSAHVALETFEFCRSYRRTLATGGAGSGNLFAVYFPALLKLFCWTPAHVNDVRELLPLMATSRTFVELFHLLLDLPLVAGALERMHAEGHLQAEGGGSAAAVASSGAGGAGGASSSASALDSAAGGAPNGGGSGGDGASIDGGDAVSSSKRGAERVLYNLLLRSEVGFSFNLWENGSTTLPLLLAFSAQTPLTHLVAVVSERAPLLLEYLLELLLEQDEATHSQLLAALLARVERVPTLGGYGARVRSVMQQYVARLIERRPLLLVSQRDAVVGVLRDSAPVQLELACVLVFCVGRHLTLANCGDDGGALLKQQVELYFQHLEVLAYELAGDSLSTPVRLRLVLLTLSCMAKLACRHQQGDLVPRVLLCLVSKVRNAGTNEVLLARVSELIRLLRNPHVASELFDQPLDVRSNVQLELAVLARARA